MDRSIYSGDLLAIFEDIQDTLEMHIERLESDLNG